MLGGREPPAAVCLDEPTRGMDRAHKGELADAAAPGWPPRAPRCWWPPTTRSSPRRSAARVVLIGEGDVVADGPAAEVLCGGWYFATETARILGGAGGALLPEEGAAAARAGSCDAVTSRSAS